MKLVKENYFILTGAMGAGKTTIIKHLRDVGYLCIDEPARQIIAEQRSIDGDGIYNRNPELFNQLMLSRAIYQYKCNYDHNGIVLFDRGIPDLIAYAELSNIKKTVYVNASETYRYNKDVFVLNAWRDIFTTDDERKMDFDSAEKFGIRVSQIYKDLGYSIIDVPFDDIRNRVKFIIESINKLEQ